MRDCRLCDHAAEDHSGRLCLYTLDCLCPGYEEQDVPPEPEFQEEEEEYRW